VAVTTLVVEQAKRAQMQHYLGNTTGEIGSDGGMIRWTFGRTSTRRGVARLTAIQSWTVGRGRPAAWRWPGCGAKGCRTTEGCMNRHGIADSRRRKEGSRMQMPLSAKCATDRALRVAISRQTAEPDGANALCGRAMPRASATTWEG